ADRVARGGLFDTPRDSGGGGRIGSALRTDRSDAGLADENARGKDRIDSVVGAFGLVAIRAGDVERRLVGDELGTGLDAREGLVRAGMRIARAAAASRRGAVASLARSGPRSLDRRERESGRDRRLGSLDLAGLLV